MDISEEDPHAVIPPDLRREKQPVAYPATVRRVKGSMPFHDGGPGE